MEAMPRFGIGSATAAALGLAVMAATPSRADREVLVMEMVSVTGTLYAVESSDAGESGLEIASHLGSRYRIDANGLGASLRNHVGEAVTAVGFLRPFKQGGLPLLRVERFTVYGG
jgi:hypothetical protein